MLATYFKEYPAHLAAAARRQAGPNEPLAAPGMDVPPTPATLEEEEDPPASESGRTYTVSDNSDTSADAANARESPKFRRDGFRSFISPERTCPTKEDYFLPVGSPLKDAPKSLSSVDRKSPSRSTPDGPLSLGDIPTFRPAIRGKCESLPLDFQEQRRKIVANFKERSLSLELKKNSRSEAMKFRSTSFDYKKLNCKSPSEIANNYLPESLKNFISLENAEEEDEEGDGGSSSENHSADSDASSSSDGDCLSTTTFNMPSPATPVSEGTHEPHCKLSARHSTSSLKNTSTPTKRSSVSSSHSVSKSTSHSHIHNGAGGCPVHGSKNHTHAHTHDPGTPAQEHKAAAHTPIHPRKKLTLSSLSSSTSRTSLADSQVLHCGICTKRFKKPKVLPCLHTFCEHCLVGYTPPESLTLTCPLCRQQSILPKDGVAGLQPNRWLEAAGPGVEPGPCSSCGLKSSMSCVQCDLILCSKCAHNHEQDSGSECHSVISLDDTSSHVSAGDPFSAEDGTTVYCQSHAGQTLRFYCRNCDCAVCSSCTDIEHRNHTTMRLNDAADDQKIDLQRLIEKVNVQMPCMKEVLCDLGDVATQLEVKKKESECEARSCFRALHDLLDQRQTELINDLNTSVTIKKNTIETQRDELQRWVSGVECCCEYVEKTLSELPPMEVVLMKKQLREKLISYVEVEFPPIPRENSNIGFVIGNIDPLKNAFKHVGKIQTNSAVPQQTTAMGDALKKVSVGKQSVITVVTRDHKGARIKTGGAEVRAQVSKVTTLRNGHGNHAADGDTTKVSPGSSRCNSRSDLTDIQVLDLNNGSYEVFFAVQSIGTYSLSLFLHGTHISASPFSLEARMPEPDLESEGSGGAPRDHAPPSVRRQTSRTSQTTKKVSSGSNARPPSQKSSCSRKTLKEPVEDDLIFKVGRRGRGRGEFVNPQGVCYSPVKDGRIVVADSNNQCIQVFNLAGDCKIKFGTRGRSVGQLQRPTGVAALPNGQYAVADYENRWVNVFEPSGKYVSRIGHGKLLGPKGMCVNRHGHIIVVDNKASCVFVFHPSGKVITKFGNRILEGYNFAGPHFCAVNSKGDIIITDFHNHCVRVFTAEGVAKFTFGTNGEGNGQFNAPTGIAVDDNDNIIVADWGNSRIQVFDNQGSFLSFVNTLGDPLYGPQGLSLTSEGNIVVADSGNHCIKVYRYLQ